MITTIVKAQEHAWLTEVRFTHYLLEILLLDAEIRSIPTHFKSLDEYADVFVPLFLQESMAQIHRSKFTERGPTEYCTHQSFALVGDKEEYIRIVLKRTTMNEEIRYGRGDIVLMSQAGDPLTDCRTHCIGYVDSFRDDELSLVIKIDASGQSGNLSYISRSASIADCIGKASSWFVTKICSLSTASREYVALMGLNNANPKLLDFVLNKTAKRSSQETAPTLRVPVDLWKCIEDNYNQFQVEAIRQSRKRAGVTLVQGPPGTGKTTTILGMLSVLLNHSDTRDDEEVEIRVGRKVKKIYPSDYGGKYAAIRLRRALAGEPISSSEDEVSEGEAEIETPRARLAAIRNSEMMQYTKIGQFKDWRDEIPENPFDNSKCHLQYSLRDEVPKGVRMIQIGAPKLPPGSGAFSKKNRILVCAPSNAAIDEIVRRIVNEGLWGRDGDKFSPSVVRLGPNVHPSLAQYSLERMAQSMQIGTSTNAMQPELGIELKAKAAVLREAQIVCSTLSVAGSQDLRQFKDLKFDTVVIDEASQAIELSTLIPLQMGCSRLILVGDHKQLPATVFSKLAETHLYARSLFERLHQSGYPMCLLKRQMRMHPAIAQFPSNLFYDGEIETAEQIMDIIPDQPWSSVAVFGPLVFFDIEEGKEEISLQSKINEDEALFVENLITTLMQRYPEDSVNRIVKRTAVITPYAEQVRLISEKIRRLFGITDLSKPCPIEVNTVDGFQGREKDIIIASTVRAAEGSIGFLADIRRMNVMLTRARTNMWIVGHRSTLTKNSDSPWAKLVSHIDAQNRVIKVTKPIESFFGRVLPEMALD